MSSLSNGEGLVDLILGRHSTCALKWIPYFFFFFILVGYCTESPVCEFANLSFLKICSVSNVNSGLHHSTGEKIRKVHVQAFVSTPLAKSARKKSCSYGDFYFDNDR